MTPQGSQDTISRLFKAHVTKNLAVNEWVAFVTQRFKSATMMGDEWREVQTQKVSPYNCVKSCHKDDAETRNAQD